MSWGVATHNGVSVSLASIVSLSCGATEFSPASLFTSGVAGAWYDPSDYSTLFQDSAGTTPVTAVEQPVGLMLDKSQGLVLGSELVTNGDFSGGTTGWSADRGGSLSVVGGALRVTQGAVTDYAVGYQTVTLVVGQWYRLTVDFVGGTAANVQVGVGTSFTAADATFLTTATSPRTLTVYFAATATTMYVRGSVNVTTDNVYADFDNFSLKALPGNHASQATAASRPVLRARYNQLTYSEQFDNAVWTTTSATVSANTTATTDPLGGNTADSLIASAASSVHRIYQAVTLSDYTLSVYAKAGTASFISLSRSNSFAYATFNLSTGAVSASAGCTATIQSAGNGWWRCAIASTVVTSYLQISVANTAANAEPNAPWLGAGENVYIWGAQAVTGSSAGTYQRIAAATDYATAGFLPYLYFVTDDSFGTNSIDFTATDKMAVCAGVTKLSDATNGCILELNTSFATGSGVFNLFTGNNTTAGPQYHFSSRGSAAAASGQAANSTTAFAAPITNVVTGQGDISGDLASLRINGAANGTNGTADQGTGNYGNYPLYIGRRNNASLPFNGNLYQLIVCGKTLSASELASTEAYVNSKTGAY